MLSQFGTTALCIAMVAAAFQTVLPLIGSYRGNPYLIASAKPFAFLQFFFVALAYAVLTLGFAQNDFSIAYIAQNSHPDLPLMYRLAAVWGAHEGSILLWILFLNLWTLLLLTTPFTTRVAEATALLGLISLSFLTFLISTSNPFWLAIGSITPRDLNPLLQDPGFIIHPPILYIGYVGSAVTFAMTQVALFHRDFDSNWLRTVRRFTLLAWCFLTLGICLGSWWAYRVLGWGGFWFWDPVENASLLPWLAGAALIHVLLLVEKRQALYAWCVFLTIVTFVLSVLGTFLVRSGVLVSAHTFASDPQRGVFLLLLFGLLFGASLAHFLYRWPSLGSKRQQPFLLFTRDVGVLLNSCLLFLAMLTILLATLYPIVLESLHLGSISVGAPYFNLVLSPLVIICLLLMSIVFYLDWQSAPALEANKLYFKHAFMSLLVAGILLVMMTHTLPLTAYCILTLACWIIFSTTRHLKKKTGMAITHMGFAIFIMGILLSSLLAQEKQVKISDGEHMTLGPYEFTLVKTISHNGSNYRGVQAVFDVTKDWRHITFMLPEKRIYSVRNMVMTKVAIDPSLFRDLYLALGEPLSQSAWTIRVYYKPFIRWIWLGGILMMIGSLLAIRRPISGE